MTDRIELTPAQREELDKVVKAYTDSAPQGWLRIVARDECSIAEGGVASVRQVVVDTGADLEQQHLRVPADIYFVRDDLLEELAEATQTKAVTANLVVERDGSYTVDIVEEGPKVLEGVRDETSSRPVHDYLDNHRAELEALAARLR